MASERAPLPQRTHKVHGPNTKVAIISIGNSRGVRLPKPILDQLGFGAEAELEVEGGRLTLAPVAASRSGWAQAFAADPPQALSSEDVAWLEAPLAADEDA